MQLRFLVGTIEVRDFDGSPKASTFETIHIVSHREQMLDLVNLMTAPEGRKIATIDLEQPNGISLW